MKKQYPIILIILIASILRFIYLDKVPNAIGGDELHYVISAKSVFLTGHDVTGTWNPWSLLWFRYPPNEHQAELPYLFHLVSSAPQPFSMLLVKLPFALLSVGIVLLLYIVTLELFGASIALATAGVAAINPWFIVMGRSAYEATPAMFFYLLALAIVLKAKKWKILWATIPLVLAFYSYIATKVILIPFTVGISLLAYLKYGNKYIKQYFLLCVFSILVSAAFYYLTITDPTGTRLGELFLPFSPTVSDAVDQIRKSAIQSPLLPLVINKYTVYFQMLLSKLLRIFSPSYLFVEGDQFFLPGIQGFFYYLDALFLFLGIVWAFARYKRIAWALWLLILIGALPQLINTTKGDFSIHLTMLFPFLLPFIGAGIVESVRSVSKRFTYIAITTIIVLYALNLAFFSVSYYFQYPLTGKNDFPKRVLSRYVQLADTHSQPVIVYASAFGDLFQKYVTYSDMITNQNILKISSLRTSPSITFRNMQLVPCGSDIAASSSSTTAIYDVGCGKSPEGEHVSISILLDGGETYKIFADVVCKSYDLKRYPQSISFNDFNIEKLSEKQFCETYISQK